MSGVLWPRSARSISIKFICCLSISVNVDRDHTGRWSCHRAPFLLGSCKLRLKSHLQGRGMVHVDHWWSYPHGASSILKGVIVWYRTLALGFLVWYHGWYWLLRSLQWYHRVALRTVCTNFLYSVHSITNQRVAWMWALGTKWLCRLPTDGMSPLCAMDFHSHEPHDKILGIR